MSKKPKYFRVSEEKKIKGFLLSVGGLVMVTHKSETCTLLCSGS